METTIEGTKYSYRGLTRKEVRELKAAGCDMRQLDPEDDAAAEKILALASPGLALDDLTPAVIMELLLAVTEATFVGTGRLKKFVALPATGLPGASGTAGNAEKPQDSRSSGAAPE